jgi:hypothetical protein
VCYDPAMKSAADDDGMDIDTWVSEMDGRGLRLEGHPLSPDEATTVRVQGGEVLVSDGPFAETKELMVGYDLLECADLDEAIEVASKHPLARRGRWSCAPSGRIDLLFGSPGVRSQPLNAVGQRRYPSPPSTRIFISSLPFTR